jgi:hypothetical protein
MPVLVLFQFFFKVVDKSQRLDAQDSVDFQAFAKMVTNVAEMKID